MQSPGLSHALEDRIDRGFDGKKILKLVKRHHHGLLPGLDSVSLTLDIRLAIYYMIGME